MKTETNTQNEMKLNMPFTVGAVGVAMALAALTMYAGTGENPQRVSKEQSNSAPQKSTIELAFITHLDANLAEQDVYLERGGESGKVYRPTVGDHNMKAPLYAAKNKISHNPFDSTDIGPYPKGEALNMTLGQWLTHKGKGVYSYENGSGTIDLEFEGLVPNGVYTMWHAFMPAVPPVPFTGTLDLPLGASDGSESVFHADSEGKAKFVHTFKPGLEMSDVWTTAILAINFHSNGKTNGGHPGKFGLNSHIPLFVMLPKREGIK